MEEGQEVTFIFDAFPLKGGDIKAATLKLSFRDKNGPQTEDEPLLKEGLVTPVEMLGGGRQKTGIAIGLLVIFVILSGFFGLKWRGLKKSGYDMKKVILYVQLKRLKNIKQTSNNNQ